MPRGVPGSCASWRFQKPGLLGQKPPRRCANGSRQHYGTLGFGARCLFPLTRIARLDRVAVQRPCPPCETIWPDPLAVVEAKAEDREFLAVRCRPARAAPSDTFRRTVGRESRRCRRGSPPGASKCIPHSGNRGRPWRLTEPPTARGQAGRSYTTRPS